jgi:CubicO group peptidase (beta-lactamase class C family)
VPSFEIQRIDSVVEPMLEAARIPGAAIAVVNGGRIIFARGYGLCDVEKRIPMTAATVYPIASTSKAINAALLGMLVDVGKLAWDEPVQTYLPTFRLADAVSSSQVTVRDLLTMRTGLPRHDWLWIENPIDRADLVRRLRYLQSSANFREKFQYSNVTATAAGHLAEIVTGKTWEQLVHEKIFSPLGMGATGFTLPSTNASAAYHENSARELLLTKRLSGEVTAPSGGSIHSTVEDMARWLQFNLACGTVNSNQLIKRSTLAQIHTPQMVAPVDQGGPSSQAAYAMGWFSDTYNGHVQLSHGGYLHDVNSEVVLFPQIDVGIVTFTNFGPPGLARLISLHVFDSLMDLQPAQATSDKLALYEKKIIEMRQRKAASKRVENTTPSHALSDYTGSYENAAYGRVELSVNGTALLLRRGRLEVPLRHWHYDAWVADDVGMFPLHLPHVFDGVTQLMFETGVAGDICAVSIPFELAVAPIRFEKQ